MKVQVVHRLAAMLASINDYTVTLIQLFAPRNPCCSRHQVAQQRSMFSDSLCVGGDMLLGNNQKMGWRLRIDVRKPDAKIIFIYPVCWNFPFNNLAEQTIVGHEAALSFQ